MNDFASQEAHMTTQDALKTDPLAWLLAEDEPGVRYLALRDLCGLAQNDPELAAARQTAHTQGPIARILEEMDSDGFWVRPGPGYSAKYRSTVWALILLAQLGGSVHEDERIALACRYVLTHTLMAGGQFSTNDGPGGTVDCLQGNLCWALSELGCQDGRLDLAYDWLARSQTGAGIAPRQEQKAPVRYYAYKCGPGFACGVNGGLPCGWGAAKIALALAKRGSGDEAIHQATQMAVDFLLSVDPATAKYPTRLGDKPNRSWWKFGFPVFYITDVLQVVEALVALGHARDPRLENALALVRGKQDELGRWPLEYDYAGKTWVDFGEKKAPSKWVTLRALRVLKAAA
jgi:hypothetical protein